jgi:lysophospholipase L1-like esterase
MRGSLLLMAFCVFTAGPAWTQQQQTPAQGASANDATNCANMPALENKIEGLEKRLDDWAQVGRFRKANSGVTAPAKDEARVVFMGDSITEGWVNPKFGEFFPGKPYIGRGIGGQTTPQMLVRFRPDVIALDPRVVVILAGTNDIAGNTGPMTLEETEGNLASMSELAHAHGTLVVLSSVMPVRDFETPEGENLVQTRKRPPEKILVLNEWIKKYAAEHGDVYLDYFSLVVDGKGFLKSELTYDGLHPNAAGYAAMAPLAQKAIDQALAKKP